MRDSDAAALQAVLAAHGQAAMDTLELRQQGRRMFLRISGREWRVRAEKRRPTPGASQTSAGLARDRPP
jgi:hypothetical protein